MLNEGHFGPSLSIEGDKKKINNAKRPNYLW